LKKELNKRKTERKKGKKGGKEEKKEERGKFLQLLSIGTVLFKAFFPGKKFLMHTMRSEERRLWR